MLEMSMRAHLIEVVIALLGIGHAMSDETCKDARDVIKYAQTQDATIKYTIYSDPTGAMPADHVSFHRPGEERFGLQATGARGS